MVPQAVQNVRISDHRALELIEDVFNKAELPVPRVAINRMEPDLNAASSALLNYLEIQGGALEYGEDMLQVIVAHEAGHFFHRHARGVGPIPSAVLESMGFKLTANAEIEAEKEADDFAAKLFGREPLIKLLKISLERNTHRLEDKEELKRLNALGELSQALLGVEWVPAEEQLKSSQEELIIRIKHQLEGKLA